MRRRELGWPDRPHRKRRAWFRQFGATYLTGVPTAFTADLAAFRQAAAARPGAQGTLEAGEAEGFRGQMLTEMAGLSRTAWSCRSTPAQRLYRPPASSRRAGRTWGPISRRADRLGRRPLGFWRNSHAPGLRVLLFTLDETTYARELAPMAGHWPTMIGPPWWFPRQPAGIRRYLDQVVETASFASMAGFNDDTRAALHPRPPASRRAGVWLPTLAAEHRISRKDAAIAAADLSYGNAKKAYKL